MLNFFLFRFSLRKFVETENLIKFIVELFWLKFFSSLLVTKSWENQGIFFLVFPFFFIYFLFPMSKMPLSTILIFLSERIRRKFCMKKKFNFLCKLMKNKVKSNDWNFLFFLSFDVHGNIFNYFCVSFFKTFFFIVLLLICLRMVLFNA